MSHPERLDGELDGSKTNAIFTSNWETRRLRCDDGVKLFSFFREVSFYICSRYKVQKTSLLSSKHCINPTADTFFVQLEFPVGRQATDAMEAVHFCGFRLHWFTIE